MAPLKLEQGEKVVKSKVAAKKWPRRIIAKNLITTIQVNMSPPALISHCHH